MIARRHGTKVLFAVEAGSSITTFGEFFVVAHPAHEPYTIDRNTGRRAAIETGVPSAPGGLSAGDLTLEPQE